MQKVKGVKVTQGRNCQAKILHKKRHTFTIIAMNYVQEQLKTTPGQCTIGLQELNEKKVRSKQSRAEDPFNFQKSNRS